MALKVEVSEFRRGSRLWRVAFWSEIPKNSLSRKIHFKGGIWVLSVRAELCFQLNFGSTAGLKVIPRWFTFPNRGFGLGHVGSEKSVLVPSQKQFVS